MDDYSNYYDGTDDHDDSDPEPEHDTLKELYNDMRSEYKPPRPARAASEFTTATMEIPVDQFQVLVNLRDLTQLTSGASIQLGTQTGATRTVSPIDTSREVALFKASNLTGRYFTVFITGTKEEITWAENAITAQIVGVNVIWGIGQGLQLAGSLLAKTTSFLYGAYKAYNEPAVDAYGQRAPSTRSRAELNRSTQNVWSPDYDVPDYQETISKPRKKKNKKNGKNKTSQDIHIPEPLLKVLLRDHYELMNLVREASGATITVMARTGTRRQLRISGTPTELAAATGMLVKADSFCKSGHLSSLGFGSFVAEAEDKEEESSPAELGPANSSDCIICQDARASTAFVPCGHKVCCRPCADKMFNSSRRCPCCRGLSSQVMRIFD